MVVERSRKREEEEKGEGGEMIKRTDPIWPQDLFKLQHSI